MHCVTVSKLTQPRTTRCDTLMAMPAGRGHTDFATTTGYVRAPAPIGRDFGEVFPDLPASLVPQRELRANALLTLKTIKIGRGGGI